MQENHLHISETPSPEAPRTVALAADLLFAGRIRGTAEALGHPLRIVRSADDLVAAVRAGSRRVLLDLDVRGLDSASLIRRLRVDPDTAHAEIIAFVSHVRTEAIDAARAAGATRVMARSAFVRALPDLLE